MPFQAKLAGVVKLFRLFPDDDIPPKLRSELLFKPGIFLLNLKHDQSALGVLLSIRFDPSMLGDGDFLNLAKQIVTKTGNIIAPKSRDLLATRISQYLKSSFRFHKVSNLFHVVYCPNTLVFMVDILLDFKKYEEDDHDGRNDDKGEFDDATQSRHHSNLNIDNNMLVSIGGSNKYTSLESKDIKILQLWLSHYIKDFGGLQNGKITEDVIKNTFLKFKPTLQLVQAKEFDEDMICSICLEKLSSDEDNTMLVRCKHVYHSNCLFKWLPNNPLCPYCRSISLTPILIG